jgi:hypothetical protein
MLAAVLCAFALAPQLASAVQSADGRYECTILGDGNVSIDDYLGSDAQLTIPSIMSLEDGSARIVSVIEWYSFEDGVSLGSVTIPSTVTKIGDGAFKGCSSLKSVAVPDSVDHLGAWAFEGCSSLETATIGSSVVSVGPSTFSGCLALRTVKLGGRVSSIGATAFNGCPALKTVTLPGSVGAITASAFDLSTTVRITPRATLNRVAPGVGRARVYWRKSVAGTISGYQVNYKRAGKRSKTVTTKGTGRSKRVSKLTRGKRYAFKVRAYRTISGKRYYSVWSGKKQARIR